MRIDSKADVWSLKNPQCSDTRRVNEKFHSANVSGNTFKSSFVISFFIVLFSLCALLAIKDIKTFGKTTCWFTNGTSSKTIDGRAQQSEKWVQIFLLACSGFIISESPRWKTAAPTALAKRKLKGNECFLAGSDSEFLGDISQANSNNSRIQIETRLLFMFNNESIREIGWMSSPRLKAFSYRFKLWRSENFNWNCSPQALNQLTTGKFSIILLLEVY